MIPQYSSNVYVDFWKDIFWFKLHITVWCWAPDFRVSLSSAFVGWFFFLLFVCLGFFFGAQPETVVFSEYEREEKIYLQKSVENMLLAVLSFIKIE